MVAAGRRLFIEQRCGGCHALAATRSPGGAGPNFDTSERLSRPQLQTSLVEGSNGMPSYADHLSARSRDALVEFLYSATHNTAARRSKGAGTRVATTNRPTAANVSGHSEKGRRISAIHTGGTRGRRVLVVGAIHGTELAGIAVAGALEHLRTSADIWVVPNLNPDGAAAGSRQDGRGVDLNRNWSSQWRATGRPWDVYYPGIRPFSERETRFARTVIRRIRPQVTIWYHQHMDVVWAWGPSTTAGRRYARLAGMRLYHQPWLSGTASNWQNHHMPGTAAFVVELPSGQLTPGQLRRQVRAVLDLSLRR